MTTTHPTKLAATPQTRQAAKTISNVMGQNGRFNPGLCDLCLSNDSPHVAAHSILQGLLHLSNKSDDDGPVRIHRHRFSGSFTPSSGSPPIMTLVIPPMTANGDTTAVVTKVKTQPSPFLVLRFQTTPVQIRCSRSVRFDRMESDEAAEATEFMNGQSTVLKKRWREGLQKRGTMKNRGAKVGGLSGTNLERMQ